MIFHLLFGLVTDLYLVVRLGIALWLYCANIRALFNCSGRMLLYVSLIKII